MSSVRVDGLVGERDRTEVMTADDLAARHADEFLAAAMCEQRLRATRIGQAQRGVCLFCGQACLPRAVYCDADCRDGHEAEQRGRARRGGSA